MAVPKKRTGHSAQGKRRSNWKATKPTLTTCPNCGQAVLAHTVCTACGTYKGKPVSKKGVVDAPVEEVKEVKEVKETKKPRKSTKKAKAEAATETPAVEETKAEEVKEEAPAEEAKAEEATEEKAE